jgi:hypothetical protein
MGPGGPHSRILRIGTLASPASRGQVQSKLLKEQIRAVLLREGKITDAHRSHRFVIVQVPKRTGNPHTTPTREPIAPAENRCSSLRGTSARAGGGQAEPPAVGQLNHFIGGR